MTSPTPIAEQISSLRDIAGPGDHALQDAIRTLCLFQRFEAPARKFFTECIEAEKLRRDQVGHPVVKQVCEALDAEVAE